LSQITSWSHNTNDALDGEYISAFTLTPFIEWGKCRCAHILHECFLF